MIVVFGRVLRFGPIDGVLYFFDEARFESALFFSGRVARFFAVTTVNQRSCNQRDHHADRDHRRLPEVTADGKGNDTNDQADGKRDNRQFEVARQQHHAQSAENRGDHVRRYGFEYAYDIALPQREGDQPDGNDDGCDDRRDRDRNRRNDFLLFRSLFGFEDGLRVERAGEFEVADIAGDKGQILTSRSEQGGIADRLDQPDRHISDDKQRTAQHDLPVGHNVCRDTIDDGDKADDDERNCRKDSAEKMERIFKSELLILFHRFALLKYQCQPVGGCHRPEHGQGQSVVFEPLPFERFHQHAAKDHDCRADGKGQQGYISVCNRSHAVACRNAVCKNRSADDVGSKSRKQSAEQRSRDGVEQLLVVFLQIFQLVFVLSVYKNIKQGTRNNTDCHNHQGGCHHLRRHFARGGVADGLLHRHDFVLQGTDNRQADPRDGKSQKRHHNADADDNGDTRHDRKNRAGRDGGFDFLTAESDFFCPSDAFDQKNRRHCDDDCRNNTADDKHDGKILLHLGSPYAFGIILIQNRCFVKSRAVYKDICF